MQFSFMLPIDVATPVVFGALMGVAFAAASHFTSRFLKRFK